MLRYQSYPDMEMSNMPGNGGVPYAQVTILTFCANEELLLDRSPIMVNPTLTVLLHRMGRVWELRCIR